VAAWIQTKLKPGPPNDRYEQEADRVADAVMRTPEPQVQRQPEEEEEKKEEEEELVQTKTIAEQNTPVVQRQVGEEEEEEEEEEELIQLKPLAEQITLLVQRQVEEGEKEEEILQPKLTVGEPNDVYEQEADALAETVMGIPDQPSIQDEGEQDNVIAQTKSGLYQTLKIISMQKAKPKAP
jgi:hypothetical protein